MGLGSCPMLLAGQEFYADYAKPDGFCDEAWKAVYQYVLAPAHGMGEERNDLDMEISEANMERNRLWEQRMKDSGADFVYFIDMSVLPEEVVEGYSCAILFGKALSKEYLSAMRAGLEPKKKEVFNTEHKMDALAVKFAAQLEAEGYKSIGKLKTGLLPHKTVALRAGLGFIGKNNLLVTPEYGCAQMLGKVLTTAPFVTMSQPVKQPQCGDCSLCVRVCPSNALLGKAWSVTTTREEIMTRKLCTLCLKCMVFCPHTEAYMKRSRGEPPEDRTFYKKEVAVHLKMLGR